MIKIALAQINTTLGDKKKNLSSIESCCKRSAIYGADIICFPELATTGYSPELLGTDLWTLSETLKGETDSLLNIISNTFNLTIICGFVERGETLGEIYNSAGIWTPNNKHMIGAFRKIHLINNEKSWFTAGREILLFDTPKCRIGVMICHDAGFPEISRILTLNGAEILFLSAAWHKENKDVWMINCTARALENGIHMVAVNRWGKEKDLNFFGGSQLIGPRGQVLSSSSESDEDLVFCQVDLDLQAKTRLEIPYLRDRRTDIYSIEYLPK